VRCARARARGPPSRAVVGALDAALTTRAPRRSYAFDLLVLNWAVQALSLYSSAAWYLFLIVPGFVLFKLAGLARGYLGGSKAEAEAQADPAAAAAEKARLDKKQRKMDLAQKRGAVVVQR
jgi:hypothetical protein